MNAKTTLTLLSIAGILCIAPAFGQATATTADKASQVQPETPPKIDYMQYDKATLAVLCQRQAAKIAALEAQVKKLKARVAAGSGMVGDATVDSEHVAGEGTWTVTILANDAPDIADYQAKIDATQKLIDAMQPQLKNAQYHLSKMVNAKKPAKSASDGHLLGYTVPRYTHNDLLEPKAAVRKLEAQERGYELAIKDLKRRIALAQHIRRISGKTSNGKRCTIIAQGDHFAAGAALETGATYTISGRGSFGPTSGTIYLTNAQAE